MGNHSYNAVPVTPIRREMYSMPSSRATNTPHNNIPSKILRYRKLDHNRKLRVIREYDILNEYSQNDVHKEDLVLLSSSSRSALQISTGIDRDEEDEKHLKQVLEMKSSSHLFTSDHAEGRDGTKNVVKDKKSMKIPIPDAIEMNDEYYSKLYPKIILESTEYYEAPRPNISLPYISHHNLILEETYKDKGYESEEVKCKNRYLKMIFYSSLISNLYGRETHPARSSMFVNIVTDKSRPEYVSPYNMDETDQKWISQINGACPEGEREIIPTPDLFEKFIWILECVSNTMGSDGFFSTTSGEVQGDISDEHKNCLVVTEKQRKSNQGFNTIQNDNQALVKVNEKEKIDFLDLRETDLFIKVFFDSRESEEFKTLKRYSSDIVEYWKTRKENDHHEFIPFLVVEDDSKIVHIDPYVCFRKREIATQRKTRRSDIVYYEKLKQLRCVFQDTLRLVTLCIERDVNKKQLIHTEMKIFRYTYVDEYFRSFRKLDDRNPLLLKSLDLSKTNFLFTIRRLPISSQVEYFNLKGMSDAPVHKKRKRSEGSSITDVHSRHLKSHRGDAGEYYFTYPMTKNNIDKTPLLENDYCVFENGNVKVFKKLGPDGNITYMPMFKALLFSFNQTYDYIRRRCIDVESSEEGIGGWDCYDSDESDSCSTEDKKSMEYPKFFTFSEWGKFFDPLNTLLVIQKKLKSRVDRCLCVNNLYRDPSIVDFSKMHTEDILSSFNDQEGLGYRDRENQCVYTDDDHKNKGFCKLNDHYDYRFRVGRGGRILVDLRDVSDNHISTYDNFHSPDTVREHVITETFDENPFIGGDSNTFYPSEGLFADV